MSTTKKYSDPTNRVVCVFDEYGDAVTAKTELIELGFQRRYLHILHGPDAAKEIDRSAKWFADTDLELKDFERELRSGKTVVSVPVDDSKEREQVHIVLKKRHARHITHFGEWVTEVLR